MKTNNLKIPVEVYSRVVGYFRPIHDWHKGKKEEFKDRKTFCQDKLKVFIDKDLNGVEK